ncbi:MAG: carbon monoxide dehydrogenase, partial [Desulfobacterota bacterium]|nr:carbon monoxide dehydrogenase [Thermodesulfobacteriota bacterium]
ILAVDADANANLNEVLGVAFTQTIGGVREKIRAEVPSGITKDVWFEMKAQETLVETDKFDLLVMGRPEGPGCYCVANALARHFIEVLTKNYQYIVIDNEAGMEHFSRLTTQDIDLLFIVSDPSVRGLQAARKILDLIDELKISISRKALLVSKVNGNFLDPFLSKEADRLNLEVAGFIPFDENIAQSDVEGKATYNLPESSPAVREITTILDCLLSKRR